MLTEPGDTNPILNFLLWGTRETNPLTSENNIKTQALIASLAGNLDPSIFGQLAVLSATDNPNLFQLFLDMTLPISSVCFNPYPYQADQYKIPDYLQLTGKLNECCDQPLCFLPRRNLAETHWGDAA